MEKVKSAAMLDFLNDKYDLTSTVPNRESLSIDNTNLPPAAAARQIIEHFNLPGKPEVR